MVLSCETKCIIGQNLRTFYLWSAFKERRVNDDVVKLAVTFDLKLKP